MRCGGGGGGMCVKKDLHKRVSVCVARSIYSTVHATTSILTAGMCVDQKYLKKAAFALLIITFRYIQHNI